MTESRSAAAGPESHGTGGIRLFNTLGRELVDFTPREPGHVRLYTCGPTVYNVVHIGDRKSVV